MATKKSTTLKAKATRRAAKDRLSNPDCPVEKLGRETGELARLLWYVQGSLTETPPITDKAEVKAVSEIITDAMRTNRMAATFLKPRSHLAAAFLIASAYADLQNVIEANNETERLQFFRSAQRALFALKEWLYYKMNVSVGLVAASHYMPADINPEYRLDVVRSSFDDRLKSKTA